MDPFRIRMDHCGIILCFVLCSHLALSLVIYPGRESRVDMVENSQTDGTKRTNVRSLEIRKKLKEFDMNMATGVDISNGQDQGIGEASSDHGRNWKEMASIENSGDRVKLKKRSTPNRKHTETELDDKEMKQCPAGFYGLNCTKKCPDKCGENGAGGTHCNIISGYCDDHCKESYWGNRCENHCGDCLNSQCMFDDGTCLSGCKDGYFGKQCESQCPLNCNGNCSASGLCLNCINGFKGSYCNETCPTHCSVCDQYNGNCSECQYMYTSRYSDAVNSAVYILLLIPVGIIIAITIFGLKRCGRLPKLSCGDLKGCLPGQTKGPKENGYSGHSTAAEMPLM